MIRRVAFSLFIVGIFLGSRALFAQQVVVKPEETDEILANPGMGWETFHHTSRQDRNLPSWIPSTIQYARWGWGELEPQPGKLNTTFLDKVLKDTHDSGQKLAFRVMCCSPYKGQPYHPKWCSKVLIADYEGQGPLPIPDMDDPSVLNAHLDFIKRLGAKYDGHPDIDHIDLGSIGWWGEWHLSGQSKLKLPTLENRKKVVDAYFAAFKKTPLLMLLNGEECTTYATQHGAGWRCDSLGDLGSFSPTWNHMRNGYPSWIKATKVQDVWKTAPIAFEPPAAVSEFVEKKWPLRWIFNYGLACHGSYFNGKSDKLPTDDHFRHELERFLRRLGYRLVLKELKHPAQVQAGGKLELSMKWQNVGSAPCYKPYRVAYLLSNDSGFSKVIVSMITVNRWLPGSIELFTPEFFKMPKDLPNGEINEVADTISLADIPTGQYTVAIGIVEDKAPVVQLAIKGRGGDGWYPISKIEVVNLEAVKSHMAAAGVVAAHADEFKTLAPGLEYRHDVRATGPLSIHVLRIDRQQKWDLQTGLGQGTVYGLESLDGIVARVAAQVKKPAVAAINGDFFVIKPGPYQGDPRGLQIAQGELVSRPMGTAFWVTPSGELKIGPVESKLRVIWPDYKVEKPLGLNEARADDDTTLYTPTLGLRPNEMPKEAPTTRSKGGTELILEREGKPWLPLQAGKTYSARVAEVRKDGSSPLQPDKMILSIGPKLMLPTAKVGDVLQLAMETKPNMEGVRTAIGAGRILVAGGKLPDLGPTNQPRHPRSMIGWNDKHLFFIVVDGRQLFSIGMTYPEMAALAKVYGCVEAVELDGGGSSTIWAMGKILNSPSDGRPRAIANGLIVFRNEGLDAAKTPLRAKQQ